MLFLFLSLALHLKTKNLKLDCSYNFSIAVHVFRNLFLKICSLFGQILITCLKYSRASFSPSSYSEKMALGTRLRLSETERFIELWHVEESLWNILSDNYKMRQKKEKKCW